MSGTARLVDARGLLCPWPAIRLARAARELGGPGTLRILADDPVAPREIAQLCVERGWSFTPDPTDPDAFEVIVR
jgi:tRNA 2-thiouridine synthesizing protein A